MRLWLCILMLLLVASQAHGQLMLGKTGPTLQGSFTVNSSLKLQSAPLLVTTSVGGVVHVTTLLSLYAAPTLSAAAPNIAPQPQSLPVGLPSLGVVNVSVSGNFNVSPTLAVKAAPSLSSTSSLGLFVASSLPLKSGSTIGVAGVGTSKSIGASLPLTAQPSLSGSASLNTGSSVFTSRLGVVNGQGAENSMYGLIQPGIQ